MNERLDLVVSGEKAVDGDLSIDGASAKLGYGKKPCKYTDLYCMLTETLHRHRSHVSLLVQ